MDFKRILTAVLMCMLIMYIWQIYMAKKYPPTDKKPDSTSQPVSPATPETPEIPVEKTVDTVAAEAGGWHLLPGQTESKDVVLGDLDEKETGYKAKIVFDSTTASVRDALLSEHKLKVTDEQTGYPLLAPANDSQGRQWHSFMLGIMKLKGRSEVFDLSQNCWGRAKINDVNGGKHISFTATVANDKDQSVLEITKRFAYLRDNYELDFSLEIVNKSDADVKLESLELIGPVGVIREAPRSDRRNVVAAYPGEKDSIDVKREQARKIYDKDYPDKEVDLAVDGVNNLRWFALANKYFAAAVRPIPADGTGKVDYLQSVIKAKTLNHTPEPDPSNTFIVSGTIAKDEPLTLKPASKNSFDFKVYLGPIDKDIFDTPQYAKFHYEHLLYRPTCAWCSFDWLNSLLVKMMKGTYKIVGNYGVAIIILVLLVRLALHPIMKKSQVNMMKMGKMGPKIEEIKKKYAGNKEEIQKQTMAVYKEQGATPILGCLPMLLQMPIWIALFTAVDSTVALRHQGLFPASWHWLTDLSAPDRLIPFTVFGVTKPIMIPILGGIDAFNLLPILLCIAMFLQMKFSPQQTAMSSNPQAAQQQKMMMYMMPVMMLLFFYTAPSGLNLYIMASTFGGLIEQHYIRKHLKAQEAKEIVGTVQSTAKVSSRFAPKKKKPKPPIRYS